MRQGFDLQNLIICKPHPPLHAVPLPQRGRLALVPAFIECFHKDFADKCVKTLILLIFSNQMSLWPFFAQARSEAFPFGEGGPRVAVDEVKERYGIKKINLVCQNKHTDKSKFERENNKNRTIVWAPLQWRLHFAQAWICRKKTKGREILVLLFWKTPPSRVIGKIETLPCKAVSCPWLYCSQRPWRIRDKSIDDAQGRSANHPGTLSGLL